MMAGGQWEIVGGKSKKTKPKQGKEKVQLPKLETASPLKESTNIYSAFMEKDEVDQLKSKSNSNNSLKSADKIAPKKKKTDKKDKGIKPSLEDLFILVNEDELNSHLATVEALYPSAPLLWLKDLASFFNLKLDVAHEDLLFAGKPTGYPTSLLNKKVKKCITRIFNRCTSQILNTFFEFCLQSLVQDTLKGLHTVGYRLMLQMLAEDYPSVAHASISKCLELCNKHQNRPNICLSLLWAVGQAGNKNFEVGVKVWMDCLFHFVTHKHCSNFVIEYLERLLKDFRSETNSKNILPAKDFFLVFDFIHSKDSKSFQKRLTALYPQFKQICYGPNPSSSMRNYFEAFLRRLEQTSPQPIKEEILNNLLYCLENDEQCYSQWRELYTKHLAQSKLLLCFLRDKFRNLPAKFPKSQLRSTLAAFQLTNEEIAEKKSNQANAAKESAQIIKEIQKDLNKGSFSWLFMLGTFLICASVLFAADLQIHGSYEASQTGKFFKNSGLQSVLFQAKEKLAYFSTQSQKFVARHSRTVGRWFRTVAIPAVDSMIDNVAKALVLAWDATGSARAWCSHYMPGVMALVEEQVKMYGKLLLEVSATLFKHSSSYALSAIQCAFDTANRIAEYVEQSPQMMAFLTSSKDAATSFGHNVYLYSTHFLKVAKSYLPIPM